MSWLIAVWPLLALTLDVAGRAVAMALPVAVAAGWWLARPPPAALLPRAARAVVNLLVHLPLVLPPVVTGWLLLLVFGLHGSVGALLWRALHLRLAFTTAGAALACAAMSLPLMARATRLAFEAVDPRLGAAAATLGAGPLDRFLSVTLPLAAPGLLAAATLGFSASLGEFGAVITFAANIPGQTQTLSLAIFSALQVPGGETEAARLALLSLGLAVAGLAVSELLARWMPRR